MSITSALRRILLVLGVVGTVLPGLVGEPGRAPGLADPTSPAAASTPPPVDVAALRRTWSWPLSPRPRVTAPFVAPTSRWGAGHRGIDVAARQGQSVLAVDDGTVTHVGVIAGRGTVSVTHASGVRSTYEPVQGRVAVGDPVREGATLGTVSGRSHCGSACLHLGALVGKGAGTDYVDPRPLLGGGPVILLPLRAP